MSQYDWCSSLWVIAFCIYNLLYISVKIKRFLESTMCNWSLEQNLPVNPQRGRERQTDRCRGLIWDRPERPQRRRGGLWRAEVAHRDWGEEKSLLCKWTSKMAVKRLCVCVPHPASVPLWPVNGRDGTMTFDTPPLCYSGARDNCYGNWCCRGRSIGWSGPTLSFMSALICCVFLVTCM